MSITLFIVILTVIVTFAAFNNQELFNKLLFYPAAIVRNPAEIYRFLTSGFIHADTQHLALNMVTLYFLGSSVEKYAYAGRTNLFIWMYLLAIILSSLPAFIKNKNNSYYSALGASGGVAAISFAFVYMAPWQILWLFFIIPVPGILFAVFYLIYSNKMAKLGKDNIGHDAHFFGAVFGFAFSWAFDPTHGENFLYQLTHPLPILQMQLQQLGF